MIRILESSSSRERLLGAADFVRSFPPATEVLIVGATRDAPDDFAREIASDLGATFGLHRFSFTQLISLLSAGELASAGTAPASALGAEAVAARAGFDALAGKQLPRFEAVSLYPGFARTLASTVSDLRLARVEPASVEAQGDEAGDLVSVLRLFEQQLRRTKVADRPALLRLATRAVGRRNAAPFLPAPVVLLDVAVSSVLERDFVQALCKSAPAALATVPAGDRKTIEALEKFGQRGLLAQRDDQDSSSGLARLRTFLFSDRKPEGECSDDQVRFFSAPGEGRECVEITRLVLDESRRGIPFDEMAVFVRAPRVYNALLETAFRRAGVPGFFARGTRRPDPSGRAFLSLLACRSEGLSAKRFAEYLSFGQVPRLADGGPPAEGDDEWIGPIDDSLGPALQAVGPALPASVGPGSASAVVLSDSDVLPAIRGTLRTPWRWEELLVESAVIGGKDRWRRRIAGLEKELRLQLDELASDEPESPRLPVLERRLVNLRHLARFALPVIDMLDSLPAQAKWGDWLEQLARLAPRVLREPGRVLEVLADLAPMSAVGPVEVEEVRVVLSERLSTVEAERPASRFGQVYVATPEQARGRSFRVVFIPGLAERLFPQRPREDPLLLDALRERLSPELDTQEDRGRRERMLLRLAVGAAEERIYLSYPRVNVVEARPRVPSFYGLDVARAVRGTIPDFERLEREAAAQVSERLAWPAPPDAARAIDAIEHDLAVLGPLLHGESRSRSEGRARYLLELNDYLGRSLRARWVRWRRGNWTPQDGIVRTTPRTEEALRAHRPSARPYSVTALQRFATCPYQFLLSAIYRLEPREEAVPLETLDALTRGRIFHRIQAEALRALQGEGQLPVTSANVDRAQKVLDDTVDRVAEEYREELAPAIERVWQDELETMRADLRAWLRRTTRDPGWEPIHFELGFGLPVDTSNDPSSIPDPVILPDGWKLRGIVDLVERRSEDGTLRVTDHKTGLNRTNVGMVIGGGEILQPVLYALALEALTGGDVVEGRLSYCTSRGGFTERVVPLHDFARLYGSTVFETIDRAVTKGALPPAPREKACRWCDFRAVCGPWEETRQRLKDPELIKGLRELRKLP